MTPIDMFYLHHGADGATPGDCFRCCIATVLDLSRDEVPHFCNLPDPSVHWLKRTQDWLALRCLFYIEIDDIPWSFLTRPRCPIVIAGGRSPRGNWGHNIVGELRRDGFTMLHDPHPSRAGIVGEPEDFGLLVRLSEKSA